MTQTIAKPDYDAVRREADLIGGNPNLYAALVYYRLHGWEVPALAENLLVRVEKYGHPKGEHVYLVSVYPPAETGMPEGEPIFSCHYMLSYEDAVKLATNAAIAAIESRKSDLKNLKERTDQ